MLTGQLVSKKMLKKCQCQDYAVLGCAFQMSKIYSMLFHPPKKVLELLLDQQATQLFTLGEGIKPVV